IESVERFGKFMLLRLSGMAPVQSIAAAAESSVVRAVTSDAGKDSGVALLVHLGMTGQLAPSPAGHPFDKHTHVSLTLDDGRELRYTDPRRFGRMAYLASEPLAQELAGFGADPMEVGAEEFAERVRSRNSRIK